MGTPNNQAIVTGSPPKTIIVSVIDSSGLDI